MSAAKPETWVLTKSENKEYFLDEWYIDSDSFSDDGVPGMVAIVNGEPTNASTDNRRAGDGWRYRR